MTAQTSQDPTTTLAAQSPAPARLTALAGPGGIRPAPLLVHLTAVVTLTADTTLSTGDDSGSTDTALARDPATGRPVWPGSTQAGLLRHHLTALTTGPAHGSPHDRANDRANDRVNDGEASIVAATFGHTGGLSALRTSDTTATLPPGAVPGRRHGNRIDIRTGLVEHGGVFSSEVLPAGTTFSIDWHLHLTPGPGTASQSSGHDSDRGPVPDALVGTVLAANGLDGSPDGIRLGTRSSRGRGTARASHWRARTYDLTTPEGFLSWHTRSPSAPATDGPGTDDLLAALRCCPGLPVDLDRLAAAVDATPDQRERIVLRLDVAVGDPDDRGGTRPGTLLHGHAPPPVRGAPRLAPLRRPTETSPQGWIDPGTAAHSLLARQARWIAHALADRPEDAESLVASLFGERPGPGTGAPRPAAVRETDAVLEDTTPHTAIRNRIDPLTQGTIPGLLFSETVLVGGAARWTILLHRPTPAQVGLLALVLRDLADGTCVAHGHGTAVGHGRRVLTGGEIEIHGDALREHLDAEPTCTWAEFRAGPVPARALDALHGLLRGTSA